MEGWTKKYIDPRKAEKSWRPKSGSMSPGLRRARQPFLVKNAITGILLGAFAVGVYVYSIRAVKQDDFDDIDEEARQRIQEQMKERVKAQATVLSVEEEKTVMERAAGAVVERVRGNAGAAPISDSSSSVLGTSTPRRRGILVDSIIDRRFPGLLDPNGKTLVWGAPSVDNIGSMRIGKAPTSKS
ncbi:mitochondrion protein [Moniliophthora roreri MCA 2997]|uniref:Cytochrome c oxidase assembly factor 3 n=1 Tax=Moniliophthora roreri (strain MCA 2997) TaxID=1381753 RepID=V2X031_MONRO|nr:mitochondrion protein [Moniliophthora roreri MCA 2997]